MKYTTIERSCGPAVRPRSWEMTGGEMRPGGGFLHCKAESNARIVLREPHLPGGGDVERTLRLNVENFSSDSLLTVHFGFVDGDPEGRGFRICLTPERLEAFAGKERIAGTKSDRWHTEREHRFRLATLGTRYILFYQGNVLCEGRGVHPLSHNEGTVAVAARAMQFRLLGFEEQFIIDPRPISGWEKMERLYEESFTEKSLVKNWVHNHAGPGSGPERVPAGFRFHRMNNSFLRSPFRSPMAMECTVRPVPDPEFPSLVTDLIVIWMADSVGEALPDRLERMNREGKAGLKDLLDIPFYWIDFGGSNNVTTRLRKNPGRHLIRQFVDRPRLLQRDRTYRLTVVQQNGFVEFHVDGHPFIRQYDAEALTCGHVGFRAFCADLELHALSVWRIES